MLFKVQLVIREREWFESLAGEVADILKQSMIEAFKNLVPEIPFEVSCVYGKPGVGRNIFLRDQPYTDFLIGTLETSATWSC